MAGLKGDDKQYEEINLINRDLQPGLWLQPGVEETKVKKR